MEATDTGRIMAKSEAICRTATALIPEGALSAFGAWCRSAGDGPTLTAPPPVIAKGKGARLTDVDGNEYVDYIGAHGALVLGHADERVVAAISKAASKGGGFGAPSDIEVRLAELIASRCSSIDMLRLVDTPTDALTSVMELAHGYTGRERIVTFEGYGYGHASRRPVWDLLSTRSNDRLESLPHTKLAARGPVRYNDVEAAEDLFRECGSTIAAVIVEPVAVSIGLIPPADGFLEALRRLCDAHGALLIFDEALSAFRTAPGGAAMLYGVTPDLTLLGPVSGGALPLSCYGGRREVMKRAGWHGSRCTSGSACPWVAANGHGQTSLPMAPIPTSGNLLGMAAGITTLQAMGEPGFYEALETRSARLDEGLRAAAAAAEVPTYHTRVASMLGMFFSEGPVTDGASARRCDAVMFARYFQAMLDRGILLPPSPSGCIFVSAAHTDDEIDQTIEAAHDALRIAGQGSENVE